jgi:hypothetical protein
MEYCCVSQEKKVIEQFVASSPASCDFAGENVLWHLGAVKEDRKKKNRLMPESLIHKPCLMREMVSSPPR